MTNNRFMKNNIRAEFRPDSIDFVNFIIKYFRVFIVTGFVAAILSAGATLLVKPLYESTVILYPSSNIAETRTMMGVISSEATLFGDDDGTEKLLQILKSEQVREYLKSKYDLARHYGIKPGNKYPNTLIAQKMKRYIKSAKTSYGSVEISVRDRNRQMACDMANDIASRADTIFNNLQREAASKMLSEIKQSYETQLSLVMQYEDSLQVLPGLGPYRENDASATLYEAYYEAMVTGNSEMIGSLRKQLSPGSYDLVTYLRLFTTLETETEYLSLIRGQYLEAQALSQQTLPYTLVVDRAVIAEKKVYPKRSQMVLVATASVLLLVALILFVAEGVKVQKADGRQ